MTHRLTRVLALSLSMLLLAGCGSNATPEIDNARVVLPPPGMPMAAGYFEIGNPGSRNLTLVGISSPSFGSVEMHQTVTENGVSRMRGVETVDVPARGRVSFAPGGLHLMLMDASSDLAASKALPMSIELRSADGATQRIEASFAVELAGAAHTH